MKTKISYLLLAMSFMLSSCGVSRVGGGATSNGGDGTGNTQNDVAFNPTTASDLKIYNYKALRQRFMDTFGLAATSATIVELDAKKNSFKGSKYGASFAKDYAAVVAVACGEIPDSVAFPDGKSITHIWKLLTDTEPNVDVKEIETDVIATTAGQPADVTTYGLCFAAMTSPPSVFINYTSTEKAL